MARKNAAAARAGAAVDGHTENTADVEAIDRKDTGTNAPAQQPAKTRSQRLDVLSVVLYARLSKTVKFLDSVRGTDKILMFIQYFSKILIWKLQRHNQKSSLAASLANFAGPVSDFRILLRYYGLLPLLQWTIASEKAPSNSLKIQTLIRLQNLVNFIYYPLEHIYWLGAHKVIALSDEKINKIGIWSCRFWAAYVVLYFGQLYEEYKALRNREHALRLTAPRRSEKQSGSSAALSEKEKAAQSLDDFSDNASDMLNQEIQILQRAKWNLFLNGVVNTAYFPLTIHWSLERSSFPDIGVGICGTVAAVAQIYLAWKST